MDFLNQTIAQVNDLFRSMTPGARVTAGLLLLLVVVSLGYLFTQQISGPDAYLMNGEPFSASELPAMEAAFSKAGLTGYKVDGARVRVPGGKQADYMGALADAKALPKNFSDAMDKALEDGGPFESKAQREQRIIVARQKELARIIASMKGIENAAVLYDTETRRGLNATVVKTASVCVKPLGSQELDRDQVSAIRYTVAGAYAGLKPGAVTVTDLNGRTYPGGTAEDGTGPLSDAYGMAKQRNEQLLKAKIENLLGYVPGVIVTTNVELDSKQVNSSDAMTYGAKPVAISSSEESLTESLEGAPPAGAPGVASNAANTGAVLRVAAKGSSESKDGSKTDSHSVIDSTHTVTRAFPFTPKMVQVSVSVPTSYLQEVWKMRNPAEDGAEPQTPDQAAIDAIRDEETTKIAKSVAPLLPKVEGVADSADLVTVSVFQDIPAGEITTPGMAAGVMTWFGRYWGMLAMLGLATFSLVMLRSMVRGGALPGEVQTTHGAENEDEQRAQPQKAAAQRLTRFSGSGPTLRDELAELVHEDTDAAANILKTWIGQTG